MVLESLSDLVETLRARITAHARPLTKSEALTRYALIDPLLRELGWNTEDPALVIPEHQTGGGSADYALLNNGSPVMMVEAKKLGTPFGDSVLSQGVNYCLMQGTNYFSVTDGQRWEVYETAQAGSDRRETGRRLRSEGFVAGGCLSESACAMEAVGPVRLWRSGHAPARWGYWHGR